MASAPAEPAPPHSVLHIDDPIPPPQPPPPPPTTTTLSSPLAAGKSHSKSVDHRIHAEPAGTGTDTDTANILGAGASNDTNPTPTRHHVSLNPYRSFTHPHGVRSDARKLEGWIGRIGFAAKGVIYAMVGGMTIASANKLEDKEWNESPQGAFVLLGGFDASGFVLGVMLVCLSCYIIWRAWEAWTAQGSDATFSPAKNFFSFRLSPAVSAGVYTAYAIYIFRILISHSIHGSAPGCYPQCWQTSVAGKIGLVLFGVAFTIAAITQIQNFATRKWHFEINWKKIRHPAERWFVLVTGHVGFFGRACSFAFVAVLMFKALAKDTPSQDPDTPQQNNLLANGLNQLLDSNTAGVAAMMVIGCCLLLYGVFATSMVYYRRFPTPPPSGQPRYTPR
ncbi:hypothetical protein HDU89_003192 [Geranomyces variabilis]|nr:hypothetical protein HDU89_003192 [Geranomyces variabilis]